VTAVEFPLVLIPCGAAKLDRAAFAAEVYTSSHFRLGLQAALALTVPERVRIVSARHGLVRLDAWLEPYDATIPTDTAPERDELVATVAAQLAQLEHQGATRYSVSLLPARYQQLVADAARQAQPRVSVPPSLLSGLGGIGYQRQALARIVLAGWNAVGQRLVGRWSSPDRALLEDQAELNARRAAQLDQLLRGWVGPELGTCAWYALCDQPAAGLVAHPVLGAVPTCSSCAARHELELVTP